MTVEKLLLRSLSGARRAFPRTMVAGATRANGEYMYAQVWEFGRPHCDSPCYPAWQDSISMKQRIADAILRNRGFYEFEPQLPLEELIKEVDRMADRIRMYDAVRSNGELFHVTNILPDGQLLLRGINVPLEKLSEPEEVELVESLIDRLTAASDEELIGILKEAKEKRRVVKSTRTKRAPKVDLDTGISDDEYVSKRKKSYS